MIFNIVLPNLSWIFAKDSVLIEACIEVDNNSQNEYNYNWEVKYLKELLILCSMIILINNKLPKATVIGISMKYMYMRKIFNTSQQMINLDWGENTKGHRIGSAASIFLSFFRSGKEGRILRLSLFKSYSPYFYSGCWSWI
jgi:hypothetical protein